MAFLPRQRLLPLIERNLADLRSVGLGQTVEDVYRSLKKVRKAGYAVAYGEVTPGAVGVAAPVFDAGGHPVASLCLTIAGNALTGSQIDHIGPMVQKAALQIGAESFPGS
jgi:DNA-binding IclR family transcriptional regulator